MVFSNGVVSANGGSNQRPAAAVEKQGAVWAGEQGKQ